MMTIGTDYQLAFHMKEPCAVLVPLYKTSLGRSELYALQNNLEILSSWPIIFVAPERLRSFLDTEFSFRFQAKDVAYFPDRFFSSLKGYNTLLMSRRFYERYHNYEYVLIVQTDALVFSDMLDEWTSANLSYVGAPWLCEIDNPTDPLEFIGVGNGGLSLRRIPDFLRVLCSFAYIPNHYHRRASLLGDILRFIRHRVIFCYTQRPLQPKMNEDAFWGLLVPQRFDFFKVADPMTAARFAFEVAPRQLFRQMGGALPFGCHAWEKYDRDFWIETGLVHLPDM